MILKMNRKIGWTCFALVAAFLIALPLRGKSLENEKTTLWKVSGNGLERPSYLFGTYHLLQESYVKDNAAIMEAFDECLGVVVEVEIDSLSMMNAMGNMLLQDGQLSDLFSQEEYNRLATTFGKMTGQSIEPYLGLKPNAVMSALMRTLASEMVATLSPTQGQPLDLYFASHGRSLGKSISPLETLDLQMKILFGSQSPKQQAEALTVLLDHTDEVLEMSKKLLLSYLDGDLIALSQLGDDYPEFYNLGIDEKELIDNRNTKWLEQLPILMEKESQFIAVGALHLVGKNGLIYQLASQGYTLTPVH